MVFLFNKAKIYSYLIAVTTVVVLFVVASNINTEDLAIQASTNNTEKTINTVVNVINWINFF